MSECDEHARGILRRRCEEILATPTEVTTEGDFLHFAVYVESPRVAEAVMELFEEHDRLRSALEEIAGANPDEGKRIVGREPPRLQKIAIRALNPEGTE